MVPEDLLEKSNATLVQLNKNKVIFDEGDKAHFYYQIKSGQVKMYNLNEEGKEFVQGIFSDGQSFGEPPLFLEDANYPGAAETSSPTLLYKLSKTHFLQLLEQQPALHLQFTKMLCQRLYYKAVQLKEISSHDPEHRILTIMDYFKQFKDREEQIKLTRQQIADLTGLRVETVIRSIKRLESKSQLKIKAGKVYR